jgi:hypothetical protein
MVESPKPQIFAGLRSKNAARLVGGLISQISKRLTTLPSRISQLSIEVSVFSILFGFRGYYAI